MKLELGTYLDKDIRELSTVYLIWLRERLEEASLQVDYEIKHRRALSVHQNKPEPSPDAQTDTISIPNY